MTARRTGRRAPPATPRCRGGRGRKPRTRRRSPGRTLRRHGELAVEGVAARQRRPGSRSCAGARSRVRPRASASAAAQDRDRPGYHVGQAKASPRPEPRAERVGVGRPSTRPRAATTPSASRIASAGVPAQAGRGGAGSRAPSACAGRRRRTPLAPLVHASSRAASPSSSVRPPAGRRPRGCPRRSACRRAAPPAPPGSRSTNCPAAAGRSRPAGEVVLDRRRVPLGEAGRRGRCSGDVPGCLCAIQPATGSSRPGVTAAHRRVHGQPAWCRPRDPLTEEAAGRTAPVIAWWTCSRRGDRPRRRRCCGRGAARRRGRRPHRRRPGCARS